MRCETFTELFERLYLPACECGIDAAAYWDMTHGEILTAIMGYRRREQAQLQAQSLVAFRQAHLLGQIIGNMFDGNCPVPLLTEAFPGIFPEFEQEEKSGLRQQDWRLMKARIEEFRARQQATKRR